MTAMCTVCGMMLEGRVVMPTVHFLEPDAAKEMLEIRIQNFDLLAAQVNAHLTQFHPKEAQQIAAVMFLSAKVAAMTYAESSAPGFVGLRRAWRQAIIAALHPQDGGGETADAPTGSGSPPSVVS